MNKRLTHKLNIGREAKKVVKEVAEERNKAVDWRKDAKYADFVAFEVPETKVKAKKKKSKK